MDSKAFDILGIGTVAVDDILYVNSFPQPDNKKQVIRESRCVGGQVGTALAAAARLGSTCSYAGVLGDDGMSADMEMAMVDIGICCDRSLRLSGARPVHSVIIMDETHHTRNIFYNLSNVMPLPFEEIDNSLISAAKVLMIDQLGIDGMIRAARIAREKGIPVVADCEWPDCDGIEKLIELIDHLVVPKDFAREYTGCDTPSAGVIDLHDGKRACTAVTAGVDGCYYICGADREVRYQNSFKVDTIDTTGCGDVFHGAYAWAIASGKMVDDCVAYAAAAAAVYASRANGWHFLPTWSDTQSLMN